MRDIETAPKDGTRVLVWAKANNGPAATPSMWWTAWYEADFGGYWLTGINEVEECGMLRAATAWLPMPPDPT